MIKDDARDMRIYNGSFAYPGDEKYETFFFKGSKSFLVVTVDWSQTGVPVIMINRN